MSSVLNSSKIFGNFPLGVKWLIQDSCNLNCSHCSYMESELKGRKSLSTIEAFEIIDKIAKSMNISEIQLLGGEPLLRNDYKEIIDRIIKNNIAVSIITNGTLVDDEFLQYINKTPLSEIIFSIDGIDEDSYGRMRKPNIFSEVVTNLDKAIRLKHRLTKIRVHYVLTRVNLFMPKEIISFFQNIGIDILSFNFLEIKGNAIKNKDKLYVEPQEYFNFIDSLYKNYESYQISVYPPQYPLVIEYINTKYNYNLPIPYRGCPSVTTEFLILSDGTFVPCSALFTHQIIRDILGVEECSLLDYNLEDIYEKDFIKRILTLKRVSSFENYSPCNDCKYLGNFCQPCFIEELLKIKSSNPICAIAKDRLKGFKKENSIHYPEI